MALTRSCALNTSLDSPEHARIAEQLGYARAWFYDSPALCADVWIQLARAAEGTEHIGLGPGVLVPDLRHPMVTASAIADLVALAGRERVAVGVGAGFTGRVTPGHRPSKWSDVATYVNVVKALLRGERIGRRGEKTTMRHYPGFAVERPVEVPFVVAAMGSNELAAARAHADGVFTVGEPVAGFDWCISLMLGTVLDDGEDAGSERVIAAAGHVASMWLHYAVEPNNPELVPRGDKRAAAYADIPGDERHIELHDGNLWAVNECGQSFVTGETMTASGAAMSIQALSERLAQLEEAGATEVAYQPAGPDIPRELEAFAKAMQG
jgi:5,10-methylenetetrahydromethanopterin reductase